MSGPHCGHYCYLPNSLTFSIHHSCYLTLYSCLSDLLPVCHEGQVGVPMEFEGWSNRSCYEKLRNNGNREAKFRGTVCFLYKADKNKRSNSLITTLQIRPPPPRKLWCVCRDNCRALLTGAPRVRSTCLFVCLFLYLLHL
jgi:hypothetical protein